jgi:nucleoside-diphosphate-sugar epimerase
MPLSETKFFITGGSGFVGRFLVNYFSKENFLKWKKGDEIDFNEASIVLHLAGKANDQKNISSPHEYYLVNTELTKKVFDKFLISNARVFITLSSVKAVADQIQGELIEESNANPITHYGKSKYLAEQYILSKEIPEGKRVYVLRPSMIYGPGNKGNLNLLYKIVSNNIPWPLGAFTNKRSFCSIDNLMFIIKELIERDNIPSGIYNIADDEPISTNELIELIALSKNTKPKIWRVSKKVIELLAKFGDIFYLPLNSDRLQKLTSSFIVSNAKIKRAIEKPLPISTRDGLLKTFKSFEI